MLSFRARQGAPKSAAAERRGAGWFPETAGGDRSDAESVSGPRAADLDADLACRQNLDAEDGGEHGALNVVRRREERRAGIGRAQDRGRGRPTQRLREPVVDLGELLGNSLGRLLLASCRLPRQGFGRSCPS